MYWKKYLFDTVLAAVSFVVISWDLSSRKNATFGVLASYLLMYSWMVLMYAAVFVQIMKSRAISDLYDDILTFLNCSVARRSLYNWHFILYLSIVLMSYFFRFRYRHNNTFRIVYILIIYYYILTKYFLIVQIYKALIDLWLSSTINRDFNFKLTILEKSNGIISNIFLAFRLQMPFLIGAGYLSILNCLFFHYIIYDEAVRGNTEESNKCLDPLIFYKCNIGRFLSHGLLLAIVLWFQVSIFFKPSQVFEKVKF